MILKIDLEIILKSFEISNRKENFILKSFEILKRDLEIKIKVLKFIIIHLVF